MKDSRSSLRGFMRKHDHAVMLAGMTLTLIAVFTGVQMLPLEGQATPMYGSLIDPGTTAKTSSIASKKASRTPVRLNTRTTAKSSSVSSAAAASKWTGKECNDYKSAECKAKLKAVLSGDLSCFDEKKCYDEIRYCPLGYDECKTLKTYKWAMDSLFPECPDTKGADCLAGVKYVTSAAAPSSLKKCTDDILCSELLSNFRRGDFNCRMYGVCQEALEAMLKDKQCETMTWCKNMKTVDLTYTNFATKCTMGNTADCRKTLGIDRFVSTRGRRVACNDDSDCRDALEEISSTLIDGGTFGMPRFSPRPECFLLPECKTEFSMLMNWACNTVHREPMCANATRVWKFLTGTNKACVNTNHTVSQLCQNGMVDLWQ